MSIDLKKANLFHEKMESNKWYILEDLKKKTNALSEVKEAQAFFKDYATMSKTDLEQIFTTTLEISKS